MQGVGRHSLAALVLLTCARPAHANVGVPMLAYVWPWAWALLAPIILIEAASRRAC
jgi:hypothetical protein